MAMRYALLVLAALAIGMPSSRLSAEVVVGVLVDGPWEHNKEITRAFEQEILSLTGREFAVSVASEKRVTGDWTVGSVSRGLDQLL